MFKLLVGAVGTSVTVAGAAEVQSSSSAHSLLTSSTVSDVQPFLLPKDTQVLATPPESSYRCMLLALPPPATGFSSAAGFGFPGGSSSSSSKKGSKKDADKPEEAPIEITPKLDMEARDALQALKGECFTYQASARDYTYKVCVGQSVSQEDGGGGRFSLGTFEASNGSQLRPGLQSFTGGDPCGAIRRSTKVSFYCSKGSSPGIFSAEEPQVCSYRLKIAHPRLCAEGIHPAFFPLTKAVGAGGGPAAGKSAGFSDVFDSSLAKAAALPQAGSLADAIRTGMAQGMDQLVKSLQQWANSRLRATAEARSAVAAAAKAAGAAGAAVDSLQDADAAGVGGRFLGYDDSRRSGRRWTGLGESERTDVGDSAEWEESYSLQELSGQQQRKLQQRKKQKQQQQQTGEAVAVAVAAAAAPRSPDAPQVSWVLESYLSSASSSSSAGQEGGDNARSSPSVERISCTVYSTDDLRKDLRSMEGDAGAAAARGEGLGSFALVLLDTSTAAGKGSGAKPTAALRHASAQSRNRRKAAILPPGSSSSSSSSSRAAGIGQGALVSWDSSYGKDFCMQLLEEAAEEGAEGPWRTALQETVKEGGSCLAGLSTAGVPAQELFPDLQLVSFEVDVQK